MEENFISFSTKNIRYYNTPSLDNILETSNYTNDVIA